MRVLYIAGAGRSGSTLLELILGNSPEFFSVGEARFFWQYLQNGSIKCGCGNLIRECDFWSQVINQLQSNFSIDFHKITQQAARIDRTRSMVLHQFSINKLNTSEKFIQSVSKLYETVWKESRNRIIVDSSKIPSHLYILNQIPNIDVHVIHLVRDGRAVAYSWNKRQKKELAIYRKEAQMPARSYLMALLVWAVENLLTTRLGSELEYYQVLRYEDFVKNPQKELKKTLSKLNLDIDLPVLEKNSFKLSPTHSVGGNPIRFLESQTKITLHEEWRKKMRPSTQKFLSIVGFKILSYYKYV